MTTTTYNYDNALTEIKDAFTDCGHSLVDLAVVSSCAAAHSAQLTAKAAVVTVDAADYGLKVALEAMPDDGEDLFDRGSVLLTICVEAVRDAGKEDTNKS